MATSGGDDHHVYVKNSAVRGFHVYKDIWKPQVSEVLDCKREFNNPEDKFAVGVTKDDTTVGHVPREFSKVTWNFIKHGGIVTVRITDCKRRHSTTAGGMVIPCQFVYRSGDKMLMKRLEQLLK